MSALVPYSTAAAATVVPYLAHEFQGLGKALIDQGIKRLRTEIENDPGRFTRAALRQAKRAGKAFTSTSGQTVPGNTYVKGFKPNPNYTYNSKSGRMAFTRRKYRTGARKQYRRRTWKKNYRTAGEKPNSIVPVKTYMQHADNDAVNVNTRTLYTTNLAFVPRQTAADEINLREGNRVNIVGVGVKFNIRAITLIATPTYFNIAIVIPRASSFVTGVEFFREWGTSRYLDFASGLSAQLFNRPINNDKYEVIMRKTILINSQDDSGTSNNELPNTPSMRDITFYTKINRAFTYRDSTGNAVEAVPILIYWCDAVGAAAGSASVVDKLAIHKTVRTVYNDT